MPVLWPSASTKALRQLKENPSERGEKMKQEGRVELKESRKT